MWMQVKHTNLYHTIETSHTNAIFEFFFILSYTWVKRTFTILYNAKSTCSCKNPFCLVLVVPIWTSYKSTQQHVVPIDAKSQKRNKNTNRGEYISEEKFSGTPSHGTASLSLFALSVVNSLLEGDDRMSTEKTGIIMSIKGRRRFCLETGSGQCGFYATAEYSVLP